MNTKIRFLVLDSKNVAQFPSRSGLTLPAGMVQNAKSPSFLDEAAAGKFATLLAQRHVGQNFYVAKVTAAVNAADSLDAVIAESADRLAPVKLVPTTAGGEGDDE